MIKFPYYRKSGAFERARGIGHVPIVQNEFVQKKLNDFKIVTTEPIEELPKDLIISLKDEIDKEELPDYIISFDGSNQEVAIDEKFPSTRIGYIQIGAVLVFLNEMLSQQNQQFVNPSIIKDTICESLQAMVLPGTNICERVCDNLINSWRFGIYEIFKEYQIEDIQLLDIYMNLVSYGIDRLKRNNVVLKKCSATKKCMRNILIPKEGRKCPKCNEILYPTDALRIHEEVHDLQSNVIPLNRTMNCLEHINLIGYLLYLINRRPDILSKIAFIIDGPLAIFGPQAWLHHAILNFINKYIYKNLEANNIEYPVIVGIEKTGNFAEHAEIISRFLEPQTVMILTEDYIYKYILSNKPLSELYGSESYYGQKIFYKTKKGEILTVTIPKREKGPLTVDSLINHPVLLKTLHLLDNIGTMLYKDALIPIALAHSYVSIPLKTGSKVLKLLTKKGMNIS